MTSTRDTGPRSSQPNVAELDETLSARRPDHREGAGYLSGSRIGRYVVERQLGQGGFGTVYLARDEQLDRVVAIKVPNHIDRADSPELARIFAEAQTIAKLKHPAIVAVHDVGHTDLGTPFVVMEYVEGRTLKELMASERPSPARAATIVREVAVAVHQAHKQGFVHRDLKPSNVILDLAGQPHVLDFGLSLHESTQRAHAGEYAGTLPYMAPEQVRREPERLDGRTDVWALGVVLYELLTGRRPFRGETPEVLEDEILHREPKPPRQIDDSIPVPLEQICLRCLAKSVTDRYLTAADLAADLGRCLRPPRRSALPAVAVAIGAVALCILAAWSAWPGASPEPVAPIAKLSGRIHVYVSHEALPARDLREVRSAGVLPLRSGDAVRFEASVSRPAYVYLVLIDSAGDAVPIYPWTPGEWEQRPAQETPVARLSAPADLQQFWPVQGASGMETALLMARDTPLPADVQLREVFQGLSPQPADDGPPLVEMENGQIRGDEQLAWSSSGDRSFDLHRPQHRWHAVLRNQKQIHDRLRSHFPLIYAINLKHVENDEP